MEKSQKIFITVAIIGAIIIISIFTFSSLGVKEQNSSLLLPTQEATSTSPTPKVSITITPLPKASTSTLSLLESSPYVDAASKFSIFLPRGWKMQSKASSATSSNTWFGDGKSTLVIGRFSRTPEMNQVITELGDDGFIQALAEDLRSELGSTMESNENVVINGQKYRRIISTYEAKKTKRQVTQYVYFSLTPEAYYRIGIDAYSDEWKKIKDAILGSVATLKLSK